MDMEKEQNYCHHKNENGEIVTRSEVMPSGKIVDVCAYCSAIINAPEHKL